jgi:adenosylcobinamide amidohydrolase
MNHQPSSLLTRFRLTDDTLVIDLGTRRPVLSSAPMHGGLVEARYVLNHQIPPSPRDADPSTSPCRDPKGYLGSIAANVGVDQDCVAFMTAVPMAHLIALREAHEDLWVEAFLTVGVTNAVRVGDPASASAGRTKAVPAGTINIILVTNARFENRAMVEAVQVVTESKTATLLAEQVPTSKGRPGATGTGTDAVAIVSGDGPPLRYCGTHTKMGELIGRVICSGIKEGLARWSDVTYSR